MFSPLGRVAARRDRFGNSVRGGFFNPSRGAEEVPTLSYTDRGALTAKRFEDMGEEHFIKACTLVLTLLRQCIRGFAEEKQTEAHDRH